MDKSELKRMRVEASILYRDANQLQDMPDDASKVKARDVLGGRADQANAEDGEVKVKAPFQGQYESAGHGFDGKRFYDLVRFVLRASNPSKHREWRWKFVFAFPAERRYR